LKKVFDRFVNGCVSMVNKFLPDSFIFAVILTILVFIIAIPVTGIAPAKDITVFDRLTKLVFVGWYGGFWNLLGFAMQMALIVVTGCVFANTPQIHK